MDIHTPAWHKLQSTGVQSDTIYNDAARKDVYPLLKHPPRRALDIGCYAGGVGRGLKEAFPDVYVWGCELNAEMAKIASTRLDWVTEKTTDQWGTAEFEQLKQVDTVFMLDVLEHMYNPWHELQFMAQHLSPGAQVILSIPNVGHMSVLANLAAGHWDYQAQGILDVTHVRFFTAYEMQRMIYQTGFKIEQMRPLSGGQPQQVTQFPITLNLNHLNVTVRDLNHWYELHAIQFGFRITVAADADLNPTEMQLRYGPHR